MRPLPRPSASPLPSYCTTVRDRPPPLSVQLRALWRWARPSKPSKRETQLADAVVARLRREDKGAANDSAD